MSLSALLQTAHPNLSKEDADEGVRRAINVLAALVKTEETPNATHSEEEARDVS